MKINARPNLSVRKGEILSAGWRRDAWFIFDGDRKISQPFPTRASARAELNRMIEED